MTEVTPREGLFVIDDQQTILECSYAAASIIGISPDSALGQSCYRAVQGLDFFGRAVCQQGCSALKALQKGHLTARRSLVVLSRSGPPLKLRCELMALPRTPGGAIARLQDLNYEPVSAEDSGQKVSFRRTGNVIRDLSTLATLTVGLFKHAVQQSPEVALDVLREATGGESAEVFLAEPRSRDMLLTTYRGPFRSAFSQIVRFKPGEGFPGMVMAHQEPILTQTLQEDNRYLRTKVKEKEFRSYVCVPLLGPLGVMGTLNIASRRPDIDLEASLRLLTWASVPISLMLQSQLLQIRNFILAKGLTIGDGDERNLDQLLKEILGQMLDLAGASRGALYLVDVDKEAGGVTSRVADGAFADVACPELCGGTARGCPELADGHGISLYGPRRWWPLPCKRLPNPGAMTYCIPMSTKVGTVGVIQIIYQRHVPSPPTRYLSLLLQTAEAAANSVKEVQDRIKQRERAEMMYRKWLRLETEVMGKRESPSSLMPALVDPKNQKGAKEPYLVIRCFGSFELYRQGLFVRPTMFQRRKALTLLKILITNEGRPVSKDTLIEMLWPEIDPDLGAERLYVVIHALRQAVEPPKSKEGWVFIRNYGDRYYFDSQAPYRLDIEEFQDNVSLGQKAEQIGTLEASISAYEAAVRLYRGDFLEDEPFEEWVSQKREYLRETYLNTLKRLATLCTTIGNLEQGIEYYRQVLRVDPLREEVHRSLIRCLWQAGRRDEALRQYQVCHDLLQKELGVPPLPETEELVQYIRSGLPH